MPTIKLTKNSALAAAALSTDTLATILEGNSFDLIKKLPDESIDLVISSPPYCMGKEYEKTTSVDDFIEAHKVLLPEIARITKLGGSICWQTGYHVKNQISFPLDYAVFEIFSKLPNIKLRNRIVWVYGHGLHSTVRFSGRHEIIMWFTKGPIEKFDLDSIRVPQKYPGKRHYKGPNKGSFSGNPLGKNPSDVWEIPNVKGNHIEKTEHPCQYPVALVQRLIKALSSKGDIIFDPFLGSGSTGVAALLEGRKFLGAELNNKYVHIAKTRMKEAIAGNAKVRPLDQPIMLPEVTSAVATIPDLFLRERTACQIKN